MVISWLLNSLSKDIAESVLYFKTARTIWKELKDRFGQSNGSLLYHLQKELSDLVQGNSNIAGYYTKVKRIWDELDSLDTCNHCSCNYSCGGKAKAFKSQQDNMPIQFLMGLNETYSGVKSNILMVSPLPSANHAYSLLIQDEKQIEMHVEQRFIESAFIATRQQNESHKPFNVDRRGDSNAKRNCLICSHCKKVGHSFDKCYRIIGFPADFKFTKGKRMQSGNVYGNATTMNDNEGSHSVPTLEKGITQEQYNHLCQLVQQVKHDSQEKMSFEVQQNT
ncbi:hypothetical protein KY284_032650 [Solanum tuberosum]|nr:hypothetical protein KY284_032650 [Solanum tuberosum]